MEKKEISIASTLCILVCIAFAGCINYSGETIEKTIQTDSDFDGWTDIDEREVHTDPFDVDTDHDGIWDPNDPDPLHPGILTDPNQKLEVGRYLEFDFESVGDWVGEKPGIVTMDIPLPKGSTKLTDKLFINVGYACERSYFIYEINESSPKVIDFFLEITPSTGWHTCTATDRFCDAPDQFELYPDIYGMHMQFFKKGDQDAYITILVAGEKKEPYSQFTILWGRVD